MSQTKPLSLKNDVKFRFLAPGDVNEIKRLCHEWFPIELVSFCDVIILHAISKQVFNNN